MDILPLIGAYAVERALTAASDSDGRWVALSFGYAAIIWMIYNQVRAGITGQSLGKRLVGLRLVKEETGVPLGGGTAVLRYLMHTIDGMPFFLGFFWPIWDAKRQTLADKLMRSVVLKLTRPSAGLPGDA